MSVDKLKHKLNSIRSKIVFKFLEFKNKLDLKKKENKKKKKEKKIENKLYYMLVILNIILCFILPYYLIILMIILGLINIYLLMRKFHSQRLFSLMSLNSVMICGAKGKGKDLLIQAYINSRGKNYYYYSNVNYGNNYAVLNYEDINLNGNSYDNLVCNCINKLSEYNLKENADIIISDCGIYFPSQYDFNLKKMYKSLPIFIALSRQLGGHNVIINSQAYGRTWLILREQFDNYILCKNTTNKKIQKLLSVVPFLRKYLFITCYYYENEETFQQKLMPFDKSGVLSRNNIAYSTTADTLKKQYDFEHGKIIKFVVPIKKNKIYYNTREFATKFFTEDLLIERGLKNDKENN